MLVELKLAQFALAEALSFEPGSGLVAVTGETGSGKSLLVNALAFVTGGRAHAEWVRTGEARCEVTAVFSVTPSENFREWLEGDDGMLVLRRELSAEGKSRAWINDRPVPVSALRRAGQLLCDLHGQNDQQGLLDSETHAQFLDCFLAGDERDQYDATYAAWSACRESLRTHRDRMKSDLQQKDFWEFQRAELDRIDPRPGEYEQLEERRTLLKTGEKRLRLFDSLSLELTDSESGLIPRLARLISQLDPADENDWSNSLRTALVNLQEAERALGRLDGSSEEFDLSLDEVEKRLHSLYSLKKKFGGSLDEALAQRATLAANLRFLEDAQHESDRLSKAETAARRVLEEQGECLHAARDKAATRLRKALAAPLSDLGLGKDPIQVHQEPLEFDHWTPMGPSRVEFLLSANPGEAPKALAKVASGGELSRILLALKSVAPGEASVTTLVFDEIDSGIGGETASRVGHRLSDLSSQRQVIVITHLHQIAALADVHFEVRKVAQDGRHVPEVHKLRATEREAALARLIAGDASDPGVKRTARALLRRGRSD